MVAAYSLSAISSLAFLGATSLATTSYMSMAMIHLHRPSAAEEALATTLGLKSLFGRYSLRIFAISAGGMLSLS